MSLIQKTCVSLGCHMFYPIFLKKQLVISFKNEQDSLSIYEIKRHELFLLYLNDMKFSACSCLRTMNLHDSLMIGSFRNEELR